MLTNLVSKSNVLITPWQSVHMIKDVFSETKLPIINASIFFIDTKHPYASAEHAYLQSLDAEVRKSPVHMTLSLAITNHDAEMFQGLVAKKYPSTVMRQFLAVKCIITVGLGTSNLTFSCIHVPKVAVVEGE